MEQHAAAGAFLCLTACGSAPTFTNDFDAGDATLAVNEWQRREPIPCLNESCAPEVNVCCVHFWGVEDGFNVWECMAREACPEGASDIIGCSSAANCALGEVCCMTRNASRTFVSSCAPSCAGSLQRCATDGECGPGEVCADDPGGRTTCRRPFCDEGQNLAAPGYYYGTSSPLPWYATAFVPSQTLVAGSLRIYTAGSLGDGGAPVALLDSVQTDASIPAPGTLLASGTLLVMNPAQWNTVVLNPPVPLTQGHTVFLAWKIDDYTMAKGGTDYDTYQAPAATGPWTLSGTHATVVQVCP